MENTESRSDLAIHGNADSVQNTMRHLRDELAQLLEQRTAVMRRIAGAKRTIVGLASLFGDNALDDNLRELVGMGTAKRTPGLTNMCRTVLMEADHGMTVQDVLEEVCAHNPALLAGHKNAMASLNTILNRLVHSGEAQHVVLNNRRRAWQWVVDAGKPLPDSATSQPGSGAHAGSDFGHVG